MLYVQQSLGPQEEILFGARFHWMYTVQAALWIFIGAGTAAAIAYGSVWWNVNSVIRTSYVDLPPHLYDLAWAAIVKENGGYTSMLWHMSPLIRFGMLACFVMGLFFFAHMMVVKATTEIAITTERIIYKRGLVARFAGEILVDRVEGVSVRQGVLGRLLGYGVVIIRGMGVGEVTLPPIEDPIEFRRVINEAKAMSEQGSTKNPEDYI